MRFPVPGFAGCTWGQVRSGPTAGGTPGSVNCVRAGLAPPDRYGYPPLPPGARAACDGAFVECLRPGGPLDGPLPRVALSEERCPCTGFAGVNASGEAPVRTERPCSDVPRGGVARGAMFCGAPLGGTPVRGALLGGIPARDASIRGALLRSGPDCPEPPDAVPTREELPGGGQLCDGAFCTGPFCTGSLRGGADGPVRACCRPGRGSKLGARSAAAPSGRAPSRDVVDDADRPDRSWWPACVPVGFTSEGRWGGCDPTSSHLSAS